MKLFCCVALLGVNSSRSLKVPVVRVLSGQVVDLTARSHQASFGVNRSATRRNRTVLFCSVPSLGENGSLLLSLATRGP